MSIYDEIENKDAILIDVRTDSEWDDGHVKNAIHIELSKLQANETLPVKKDDKIYTYCRSGSRSQMANMLLAKQGYLNVENLGGIRDVLSLDERFQVASEE